LREKYDKNPLSYKKNKNTSIEELVHSDTLGEDE